MGTSFWLSFLLFLAASWSWGQVHWTPAAPDIPENEEARIALRKVITAPVGEVLAARSRPLEQRATPLKVQFRVETQRDAVYLLFLNERPSGFPVNGSGSVVVKRSLQDGSFQQMKIYFRDEAGDSAASPGARPPLNGDPDVDRPSTDPGSFVRIFPDGVRCRMDVFLFGRRLYTGVVLPAPFESLLLSPFERIRRLSAGMVDWPLLLHRGDPPSDNRALARLEELRKLLPALRGVEDGALDADGRYVRIADLKPQEGQGGLNCSGFAKWVVDGFYRPLTGRYLEVEELKARLPGSRSNRWSDAYEQARDPYFGLDWSRNLAGALWRASGSRQGGGVDPEVADVRLAELLPYVEDVGYRVEDLELVLFVDAAREPGCFYLASVNSETGGRPVLHQHFHLAVLFPFFLPDGAFRVRVLERYGAGATETPLAVLRARYPGGYVHLTRLPLGEAFTPPPVPLPSVE